MLTKLKYCRNGLKGMDTFIQGWVPYLKHSRSDHIAVIFLSTCKTLHGLFAFPSKTRFILERVWNNRESELFKNFPKTCLKVDVSLWPTVWIHQVLPEDVQCSVAHSLNQEAPLTSKVGDKIQQDNITVNNFPSLQFPFSTYNTTKKKKKNTKTNNQNCKEQTTTPICQSLVFRHKETKLRVGWWLSCTFLLLLPLFLFINSIVVSPVLQ